MPSLGDILSAAVTGRNQQDVDNAYNFRAAQVADTMAQVPLRGAQTEEALATANEKRLAAIAAQKKQDALDHFAENEIANGRDPQQSRTLGDVLAAGGNYEQGAAGLGHLQEQGFRSTLADPTASGEQQRLASQGVTGKLENPYATLPPDAVDLRGLAPPGAPPHEIVSKIGAATIGAKEDKLKSKDDAIDPDEMAYWGHRYNTTNVAPSFGMGQSKTRQAFLKAAYLDAAGIPVTAATLGIAAPGTQPGKPTPGAVPPLSPAEAANGSAASVSDFKSNQTTIANAKKMLGVVQAQEYTASHNFDLALSYADKLDNTGSPLINRALVAWNTGVAGDPKTQQFVNALQAAHDEYAKVLSGATGAAGITDAARKEADKLFNHNMNLQTLRALRDTVNTEMGNRRMGYVTTIQATREGIAHPASGGITGAPGAAAAAPAATGAAALPPAAAAALKEGFVTKFGNGQKWTLQGGKPVQVQ